MSGCGGDRGFAVGATYVDAPVSGFKELSKRNAWRHLAGSRR